MPVSEQPLVERIARVLAGAAHSSNAEGSDPSAGEKVDLVWREHVNQALAVLHTMREPDAEMAAAGDAEKVASAMLTRNADLDAIWAVWDVPAEGVLAAARANGRNDLDVTTIDLGQNVAIDMAKGGPIKGLGAQRPFDQGVTEATLAGYGLLDKKAPPYVAVNALPVTRSNLESAWKTVYHQGLPPKVVEAEG